MQNAQTSRDSAPAPSLSVLINNKKAGKTQPRLSLSLPPRVPQLWAHGNWGHRGQCVTDGDGGASFPSATGMFQGRIRVCKENPHLAHVGGGGGLRAQSCPPLTKPEWARSGPGSPADSFIPPMQRVCQVSAQLSESPSVMKPAPPALAGGHPYGAKAAITTVWHGVASPPGSASHSTLSPHMRSLPVAPTAPHLLITPIITCDPASHPPPAPIARGDLA